MQTKHSRNRQRQRRGFTLVELLVSILILSLALISLGQLYLTGMWTTQKARNLSLATQRAQAEMERAQDLGILVLQNGPSEASYPSSEYQYDANGQGVTFEMPSLNQGQGSVRWQRWPPNTTGNDNLLKVDIIVTWEGARRTRSDVHLVTLLTNKR